MRQKVGQMTAFLPSTPDREDQRSPQGRECCQTAERSKAQRQRMPSGRTSMLELPANVLLATHPACSERRHRQPSRRSHERKLGDQTKDDADKEPREERSCGRSQTLLYNGTRTHLSLEKEAPVSRAVDRAGHILCRPILGGLHHQYARI